MTMSVSSVAARRPNTMVAAMASKNTSKSRGRMPSTVVPAAMVTGLSLLTEASVSAA